QELQDGRDPAADPDVLAPGGLPGNPEGLARTGVEEVEGRVAERERRARMVRQDEDRGAERRVLTPPAPPRLVRPGAADRGELVAPHDLGPDVVGEVPYEVVVHSAAATGFRAVGPAVRGAGPAHEGRRIELAERPFPALVDAGGDAIPGDGEVVHPHARGAGVRSR